MGSFTEAEFRPIGSETFPSTHWSAVLVAGQPGSTESHDAFSRRCEKYWYPLYAYVRRKGHPVADAQDLTQDFFLMLLEKNGIARARSERGRFRSFLLTSLNNFLINDWNRRRAEKRGGGRVAFLSDIETAENRYRLEPRHEETPEKIFEAQWALTLLQQAMAQLEAEWKPGTRKGSFERLKPLLTAEADSPSYKQVATENGMTEGAVKVAIHRLRKRLRELVCAEIAHTVEDPGEIQDEVRHFIQNLAPVQRV